MVPGPVELVAGCWIGFPQPARWSAVFVRGGFGALSEVCEEAADPFGDGVVPLNFAGPAAFDGVLGELLFTGEPGPQARCVLARGEELRAAEVEVALAGPFGRCPPSR